MWTRASDPARAGTGICMLRWVVWRAFVLFGVGWRVWGLGIACALLGEGVGLVGERVWRGSSPFLVVFVEFNCGRGQVEIVLWKVLSGGVVMMWGIIRR